MSKSPSNRPAGLQALDEDEEVNPETEDTNGVEFVEITEYAPT